jgi:hypothetical protein
VADATDTIVVDVNRSGLRSLEAPDEVTVDRSFTVELRNHGEPTHVHLHLDDQLSEFARLVAGNHHVPSGSTRPIEVRVSDPDDGDYRPVHGKLKVVVGYGQVTRFVDITVDLSGREPATVDPELAQPGGGSGDSHAGSDRADGGTAAVSRGGGRRAARDESRLSERWSAALRTLPAVVLAVLALGFAAASLGVAGPPDLSMGGLAVVAAVLAAAYLLLV